MQKSRIGWGAFAAVAAASAWVTMRQMSGMEMAETLPLTVFMGSWITMMAAMMLPSMAPVSLMWARSIASTPSPARRLLRNLSFSSGYLVVWAAFGLLAFLGSLWVPELTSGHGGWSWVPGSVLILGGLYQLTPLKEACLKHCRSPMDQLLRYASLRGALRDLRVGVHHGIYCLGCCWGIMLVLIAVGSMNLLAATLLGVTIFIEKVWAKGSAVTIASGALMIAFGVLWAGGWVQLLPM